MNRSIDTEIKVGVFVLVGVILACISLIIAGGEKSFFEGSANYTIKFTHVDGLQVGSTVKIAGFRVGTIDDITFREDGEITLAIKVLRKYTKLIKEDSLASLGTQGVLGDKYVTIAVGSAASPKKTEGSSIEAEHTKEFKDYLSKGDQLIESMNSSISHLESILASLKKDGRAENMFKNMSAASSQMNAATKELPATSKDFQNSAAHMKSIMAKIDRGEGTLGALINDQSLYDDLKALLGGANRNKVLKYFIKKSVEESREAVKDAALEK